MSTFVSTDADEALSLDPPQAESNSAAAATTVAENLNFRTVAMYISSNRFLRVLWPQNILD